MIIIIILDERSSLLGLRKNKKRITFRLPTFSSPERQERVGYGVHWLP